METISSIVAKRRLKWAGHVRRMPDHRLPKKVLFGKVVNGKTKPGRPDRTWMDYLEEDCCRRNITNWIAKSKDRLEWRRVVAPPP